MKKSLISTASLDLETVKHLMALATERLDEGYATSLRGHTCATLFFEPSTRTRLSFELAAQHMEMNVLNFNVKTSSLTKGESFEDTLDTLMAMEVEAVILRHKEDGLHERLLGYVGDELSIINAGSGVTDHPTQALLDALTLYHLVDDDMDRLCNLTIGIVGDLRHSRVASAHIALAKIMGWNLVLIAPDELQTFHDPTEHSNINTSDSLKETLPQLDVVMALRLQKERLGEGESCEKAQALVESLQITEALMNSYAQPECKVMHPGPINWGVELGHCLSGRHNPRTLMQQQVRNGVAIRMAALEWCLNNPEVVEEDVNPAL